MSISAQNPDISGERQSGQDVRTQNASETLIEHLRSENQDLKATLDTLRDEITEIRSTRDKERLESQKCLVEEERKSKNDAFFND
ncbi:hypothetical protein Bca101_021098 [Brassica carinata]